MQKNVLSVHQIYKKLNLNLSIIFKINKTLEFKKIKTTFTLNKL